MTIIYKNGFLAQDSGVADLILLDDGGYIITEYYKDDVFVPVDRDSDSWAKINNDTGSWSKISRADDNWTKL